MALTPDDIAQKVFTPRFRGIDPVEVREFLLLAAAQINDLHEQIRQHKEQLEDQEKELSLAADDKKSFDDVLDVYKQKIDTLTAQLGEFRQQQENRDEEIKRVKQVLDGVQKERDNLKGELGRAQASLSEADADKQKIDTLTAQLGETRQQQVNRDEEIKRVKQLLDGVQQERDNLKGELGRAQTSLSEAESKSRMSRAAIEGLRNKIVVIEAEKAELLSAAEQHQKTIDEARQQSDDLSEKTKLQVEQMVAEAKEEIAELRDTASRELVAIREDIDTLNAQRRQLHTELRDLLHDHLDRLSEYTTGSGAPSKSEYDELFQKIDFAELAELEEDAALDELAVNEQTSDEQAGESEETLRTKLQDGGIAYLSDE